MAIDPLHGNEMYKKESRQDQGFTISIVKGHEAHI